MPIVPLLMRRLLPAAALVLAAGCAPPVHSASTPPLVKGKSLRILPLGDSITRGSQFGNYRRSLQALLARTGYAATFVGESTESSLSYSGADPEQTFNPFQPVHEGYGGFRIEQIAGDGPATDDGGVTYPGLTKMLAADRPDAVLLMLGTNDVNQGFDPGGPGYGGGTGFAADAAGRLDSLLSRLAAAAPKATVVLAAITPLGDSGKEPQVQAYNALVPQVAAAHRRQGQNVLFVDMSAALTTGDLISDGVHPNTVGYDKMARVWYKALTGQAAPPLPVSAPPPSYGPGSVAAKNLFGPADTVTASNIFNGSAFAPGSLVDGTPKAFVFGDSSKEIVAISGFHGAVARLRFFDAPAYGGRTPVSVTLYYSPSVQASLLPSDYTKLGTYPLPVSPANPDVYPTPTQPAEHPDPSEPAPQPDRTISFVDLDGLHLPATAETVLLDFSKPHGDGDGLSEIQAYGPSR